MRRLTSEWLGVVVFLAVCWTGVNASAQGMLDLLRQDVRTPAAEQPDEPNDEEHRRKRAERAREQELANSDTANGSSSPTTGSSSGWGDMSMGVPGLVAAAAVSPFWLPRVVSQDTWGSEAFFPRFPYDYQPGDVFKPGYLQVNDWPAVPRRWAGRFQFERGDEYDRLSRLGGRLILDTSTRFGLDIESHHFEERLGPPDRYDTLWLGDANLIFRFAQGEHAMWRAGLGFNWLTDDVSSDYGFNFTYGVDLFPVKPLVLSAAIDWGTLGRAELFRFRATVGLALHGIEPYVGYEYLDIDRFHSNCAITGVQVWF